MPATKVSACEAALVRMARSVSASAAGTEHPAQGGPGGPCGRPGERRTVVEGRGLSGHCPYTIPDFPSVMAGAPESVAARGTPLGMRAASSR